MRYVISKTDLDCYSLYDTKEKQYVIENESIQVCENVKMSLLGYSSEYSECDEVADSYLAEVEP